jgi:pectate lyase
MRRSCWLLVVVLLLVSGVAEVQGQVKAFPTAEGFGAVSVGGRGGAVIEVTNLGDTPGTGSFRDCAEATGARTCVFRVGGVITLNTNQHIRITAANSFLTIAGQTAPGEGVTITQAPIDITEGAHDIIIRHLRLRLALTTAPPPATANGDCSGIVVYGDSSVQVKNVIIDHASVGYACDDSAQGYQYVSDTTYQWSLFGEGYESVFGDPFGSSKGFLAGGSAPEAANATISFHHNLLIHNVARSPAVGPIGVFDFRNNLVYNWWACRGSLSFASNDNHNATSVPTNINFVGNVYLMGPNTDPTTTPDGCWLGSIYTDSPAHIYVQDNATPYCGGMSCPADTFQLGWGNGTTDSAPASEAIFRVATPFTAPPITMTPRATLESVLAPKVGAIVPLRDSLDTRLLSELNSRTGDIGRQGAAFPTLPTSSAAPTDTDHDGMPDSWETSHGLNPNNAADRNTVPNPANGYTNLEIYLNELAGDGAPAVTEPGAEQAHGRLALLNRQHPLAKGLVAFFYGVPGTVNGPRYYDIARRYHGMLTGFAPPTWMPVPSLPGIRTPFFDGTDDRVLVASVPELQPAAGTWLVLAKSTSSTQNQFAQLLGKDASLDLTANPGGSDSTQVACYVNNTDGPQAVSPTGSLPVGAWVWAGCTFNPARGAPQLRTFVNGKRVAQANSALAIPYTGASWFFGGDLTGAAAFRGAIGPVLVWNYALSDMQMAQVQQLALTRFEGLLLTPSFAVGLPSVITAPTRGSFLPFLAPQ